MIEMKIKRRGEVPDALGQRFWTQLSCQRFSRNRRYTVMWHVVPVAALFSDWRNKDRIKYLPDTLTD